MSISAIGSTTANNTVLAAFAASQERIAILQQEAARRAERERNASLTTNVNNQQPGRNQISANANNRINDPSNSRIDDASNANARDARTGGFDANNGINGNQISLLAAQYDVNAQVARNPNTRANL